jgi:hypothetical protein
MQRLDALLRLLGRYPDDIEHLDPVPWASAGPAARYLCRRAHPSGSCQTNDPWGLRSWLLLLPCVRLVCAMWEGVSWGPEPANGNSGGLSCRVELVRDPVGRHHEGHALCIPRTKESVADYGISLIRCIIVEFEQLLI